MIFPGVLLISGSGANDKNGTSGFVHRYGPKPLTPYLQIAQYLSERGFAVLRYDKRGIGANFTNALIQQPEVDPERISLIGHGEGAIIAPRVAIDNSTKVKTLYLWARQLRTFQI
jgi:alpha-beta hydrolase superfamily lysophospholipase